MGKGRGGLPDRWLDYVAVGRQIKGVPIIACKVPLKEELVRHTLNPEQWFTPDILVETVPNVGCIVDLTATNRYYNPIVFTQRGIHHEKIFCAGHVIPNNTTVQRFFQVVDDFLHSVDSRGKVLMVHCTHGLNRTGYLVSRYMVERRGFLPAAAIEAFNEARGHRIERSNYLEHLRSMSQQVCPNPVPLYSERPRSKGQHSEFNESEATNEGRPSWRQRELPASSSGYNSRNELVNEQRPDERAQRRSGYPSFSYEPVRSQNVPNFVPQWRSVPPPVENPSSSVHRPSYANHGRHQSSAKNIPTVADQGRYNQRTSPGTSRDRDQQRSYNPHRERQNAPWTVTPSVEFTRARSNSFGRSDVIDPPSPVYQMERNERRYQSNSYASNDPNPRSSSSRSVDRSSIRTFEDRSNDTRPSSTTRDNYRSHHQRFDDPRARTNPPSQSERPRPTSSQEGAAGQTSRKARKSKRPRNARYGRQDGAANWRTSTNSS